MVDLPAPFGPRRATVSPGYSLSESPSTARTLPYVLLTWSKPTTGVVAGAAVVVMPSMLAARAGCRAVPGVPSAG